MDYIKIFRGILEWEWWHDINTFRLFIYILLKANWKDSTWKGIEVKRGSFISSLDKLAEDTDLTRDEVRTALKHLTKTKEITTHSTRKYTVFSVVNYDLYQSNPTQITTQIPDKSHTIPLLIPSIEEKKEIKNNKNHCASEPHDLPQDKDAQLRKDFEVIYGIYPKKKGKTVAFANYKLWVTTGKDVSGRKYRLTNRQIYLAVKKYIRQQEEAGQDDYQYWKNFDTLMGRQLLDYVELEDGKL